MTMKRYFLYSLTFSLLLTAIPALPAYCITAPELVISAEEEQQLTEPVTEIVETSVENSEIVENTVETVENSEICPIEKATTYKVLDVNSGEIWEISVREYLIGSVSAEMPASFSDEALKAQAVAVHTYAERQHIVSQEQGKDYDFTNDPAIHQAYYTENQLRERWGNEYDTFHEKISSAVDAVKDELLFYDEEPILSVFHAMSSGKTDTAGNVWGSDKPYLQSVDSVSDKNAPQYEKVVTYTAEQVRCILGNAKSSLYLEGNASEWFGTPNVTDAGTVLSIPIGNETFTGQEIKSLFGLRSASFSIDVEDNQVSFTTYGFGHNVGMSQYGANAMAKDGCTYQEILAYYYPNTSLQ